MRDIRSLLFKISAESSGKPLIIADRTAETLSGWLKEHPGVELISRDRSSEYARGASAGAPEAQQVADRWHVLNNLAEVVQRIVS